MVTSTAPARVPGRGADAGHASRFCQGHQEGLSSSRQSPGANRLRGGVRGHSRVTQTLRQAVESCPTGFSQKGVHAVLCSSHLLLQ